MKNDIFFEPLIARTHARFLSDRYALEQNDKSTIGRCTIEYIDILYFYHAHNMYTSDKHGTNTMEHMAQMYRLLCIIVNARSIKAAN